MENEKAIIKIKEKYDRKLLNVELTIKDYKLSNNSELLAACNSLIDVRDELVIIVNALEKQIPLLVVYEYDDEFTCPACNFEDDGYDVRILNVCPKCGQRLTFESEDSNGKS